jgi:hypothetical protein
MNCKACSLFVYLPRGTEGMCEEPRQDSSVPAETETGHKSAALPREPACSVCKHIPHPKHIRSLRSSFSFPFLAVYNFLLRRGEDFAASFQVLICAWYGPCQICRPAEAFARFVWIMSVNQCRIYVWTKQATDKALAIWGTSGYRGKSQPRDERSILL